MLFNRSKLSAGPLSAAHRPKQLRSNAIAVAPKNPCLVMFCSVYPSKLFPIRTVFQRKGGMLGPTAKLGPGIHMDGLGEPPFTAAVATARAPGVPWSLLLRTERRQTSASRAKVWPWAKPSAPAIQKDPKGVFQGIRPAETKETWKKNMRLKHVGHSFLN